MTPESPLDPVIPELGKSAFKIALDVAPHAIVIHDNNHVVYANHSAAKMLRAESAEQLIGERLLNLLHPDYHEASAERRQLVFEHGHGFVSMPLKLVAADGTTAYAEGHAMRIFDGGRPFVLVRATSIRYEE